MGAVTFTGTAFGGLPPYTLDWDFDNDDTYDVLNDPAPAAHNYPGSGDYTAKLRVTDFAGNRAYDKINIHIVGDVPEIIAARTYIRDKKWYEWGTPDKRVCEFSVYNPTDALDFDDLQIFEIKICNMPLGWKTCYYTYDLVPLGDLPPSASVGYDKADLFCTLDTWTQVRFNVELRWQTAPNSPQKYCLICLDDLESSDCFVTLGACPGVC